MSDLDTAPRRGRPRDERIAASVLEAALHELATKGYAGFSLAAVAAAARTTRPAIYRRWKDKDALIVDAVAHLAATAAPEVTGDHFRDLVAELDNFRHCIRAAGALPLAGVMLGDEVEPTVRATYVERVVGPRRRRLRAVLARAVQAGELRDDADLDVAVSMTTGSWYAFGVAGREAPRDWPRRTATLIWRACGGTPPPRSGARRSK